MNMKWDEHPPCFKTRMFSGILVMSCDRYRYAHNYTQFCQDELVIITIHAEAINPDLHP